MRVSRYAPVWKNISESSGQIKKSFNNQSKWNYWRKKRFHKMSSRHTKRKKNAEEIFRAKGTWWIWYLVGLQYFLKMLAPLYFLNYPKGFKQQLFLKKAFPVILIQIVYYFIYLKPMKHKSFYWLLPKIPNLLGYADISKFCKNCLKLRWILNSQIG